MDAHILVYTYACTSGASGGWGRAPLNMNVRNHIYIYIYIIYIEREIDR